MLARTLRRFGMTRVIHRIFVTASLALSAGAESAHADFYALDGRFQCLSDARAVCYDARTSRPAATPTAQAETPNEPAAAARESAPPPNPIASPTTARAPVSDPILEIAARIKSKRPADDDIAVLKRAAAAHDPRAIELLAWCTLRGIGTTRDATAAFLLYGEAAASAVPHARENQAAIYTQVLSSEERQRILQMEATPSSARRVPDQLSANDKAPPPTSGP
jgi:TPR repeat protein